MLTDEELALEIKQGQVSGLSALVERHHKPLIGYLFRMTGGDRPLAEDLAQETFLRSVRAIQQYQYPRPFKPWLYRIATNLARDHYRSANTRYAAGPSDEETVSEGPLLEDDALEQDELRQVVTALHALPDHQREIVVLRYYQELSLNEISETLAVPLGTVKSRLSVGLRRLRDLMEKEMER